MNEKPPLHYPNPIIMNRAIAQPISHAALIDRIGTILGIASIGIGASMQLLALVGLFAHIPFPPPSGMGLLLMTVGFIALRVRRL